MLNSILAIRFGASIGAVMRWLLGLSLNSMFPTIPPGTLIANLLGGYQVGRPVAFFAGHPDLTPEQRPLCHRTNMRLKIPEPLRPRIKHHAFSASTDVKVHLKALKPRITTIFLMQVLALTLPVQAQTTDPELEFSYRFLVSGRDSDDGILYTAKTGQLKNRRLPLSFAASAEYWGAYVCRLPGNACRITDVYSPQTYTLTPQKSTAGDLQIERINTHNGSNIYDAATWQIAVMLGKVINRFPLPNNQDAYALVSNQNHLLKLGYNGNSSRAMPSENRAVTAGHLFAYNQQIIVDPKRAYAYRMLPQNWLSSDPFVGTTYMEEIAADGLPAHNPDYQPGKVTWTDWKPFTGENAWAFLLGPLQAAYVHYIIDQKSTFVPLHDPAVQNALNILPTFAAMQSPSGGVYYAPNGTVMNQGDQLVNPYEVSVENNFSLYAGLKILSTTLQAVGAHEKDLSTKDRETISEALQLTKAMINGGVILSNRTTAGLLSFFRNLAWRNGEFVQGGRADDPNSAAKWLPNLQTKAVDVNTWGIAALGPEQIDTWFGFGAAYKNWQQVKGWGGYGIGKTLWGVGFTDQDGNGIDADGNYRQGILSTEWTAGAITMLRCMIGYYQTLLPGSLHYGEAKRFTEALKVDEQSMLAALENMRIDTYTASGFPGQPDNYQTLQPVRQTRPYLYASKRYLIPFGWYANPIPSTCATAWMVMVADGFNPFVYSGR